MENLITGNVLIFAGHAMLEELQMKAVGDRIRLLNAIYYKKLEHKVELQEDDYIPESQTPSFSTVNIMAARIEELEKTVGDQESYISRLKKEMNALNTELNFYKDRLKSNRKGSRTTGYDSPSERGKTSQYVALPHPLQLFKEKPTSPSSISSSTTFNYEHNGETTIRVIGNQLPDKQHESYKTFRISNTDDVAKLIGDALHKYKISTSDWRNYILMLILKDNGILILMVETVVLNPTDKVLEVTRKYLPDELVPQYIIRHVRHINVPNSKPINIEPGTFMAANLGLEGTGKAIAIYEHEAQSRGELNVYIGEIYSIIAKDNEWCIVEHNGQRGSVPTLCLHVLENLPERKLQKAYCLYEFNRKLKNELSVRRGEQFVVLDKYQHWYLLRSSDTRGMVRANPAARLNVNIRNVMSYNDLKRFDSNTPTLSDNESPKNLTDPFNVPQLIMMKMANLSKIVQKAIQPDVVDVTTPGVDSPLPLTPEKVHAERLEIVFRELDRSIFDWESRLRRLIKDTATPKIITSVRNVLDFILKNIDVVHEVFCKGPLAGQIVNSLENLSKRNIQIVAETKSICSKLDQPGEDKQRVYQELEQYMRGAIKHNYTVITQVSVYVLEDLQVASMLNASEV
ncbi:Adaptor for signal transduction [Boothiomyces macroporosus]|uniref:Adaptor for signal transduction n=1 Tax=Boothiomyces macroporosus TaxID=261099 RepID=A0AAD5YAX8_9FUNG|nr:Adaptor for signal transduction [Boothiomyces macroporosus]